MTQASRACCNAKGPGSVRRHLAVQILDCGCRDLGFRDLGFRDLGFRDLGFRV